MASETATLTTMSSTNATPAPRKLAPWPGRLSTPVSERVNTATAPSVPNTRPAQPADGDIRFQNMPRMNVANSGALKNENRDWM